MPRKVKSDISNTDCSQSSFFTHKLQLQLYDLYGVPVPNTQFWITIKVRKRKDQVTLQFPTINFQTGQYANNVSEPPSPIPPFISGGYLYTSDGYLPPNVRPTDLVNRSWLAPSDNGVLLSFSFTQPSDTLPNPIAGYILQVTNAGGIVIQGAGTFGNIIPAGNQTMLPTTIEYIVEPTSSLSRNIAISRGATNITQFGFPGLFDEYRDFHINDAYNGVAAWAWVDNSTVVDKTNNVLNVMVAVGQQDSKGNLKVGAPVQLTNVQPPLSASFDSAVAISRLDSNIIVVSYTMSNFDVQTSPIEVSFTPCRAISFDGGKTWPAPFDGITPQLYNGPLEPSTILPTGPVGLGDYIGVASDKYGNIWCCVTNYYTNTNPPVEINQPYFIVSTDEGRTFSPVYTFPFPEPNFIYDVSYYCFGGDGKGNYGLHFTSDYGNLITGDMSLFVGFIPITGLGEYNVEAIEKASLTNFTNNMGAPDIAASSDGRVWLYGNLNIYSVSPQSNISSTRLIYKSPGDIAVNYAGPWDFSISNHLNTAFFLTTSISAPFYFGYFNSARTVIYDEKRQALYALTAGNQPDFSQNMQIYLAISRDNGLTWSSPIAIATTDFANRGFQTMALDTITGNLLFGWYDGRNDPTFKSVEYFAAIIKAKTLNKLVKRIPLSNPIYIVPPATNPSAITKILTREELEKRKNLINNRRNRLMRKIVNNTKGIKYLAPKMETKVVREGIIVSEKKDKITRK